VTDEDLYQLRKHEGDIDCVGAADEILTLRAELERLRTLSDARDKAVDALERMHNGLGAKYREAVAQLDAASKACNDLDVQARFWRQCAEHAVTGWNALEDEHERVLDVVEEALDDLNTLWLRTSAPEEKALDKLAALLERDDAPEAG